MTKRRQSFIDNFTNWDMYGKPITLSFNGEEEFKTGIGGLLTLITYIFVGVYFLVGFIKVAQNQIDVIVEEITYTGIDTVPINPYEIGFRSAIGI